MAWEGPLIFHLQMKKLRLEASQALAQALEGGGGLLNQYVSLIPRLQLQPGQSLRLAQWGCDFQGAAWIKHSPPLV